MVATEDKVRELFAIWNSHSTSKLMDHFAEDVVLQDALTPATKGKAAVRALTEAWFKAFPDVQYTPTTVVVAGDVGVALYVATATFRAPLVTPEGTIPATHRHGGWTGCVVMTFDAKGKVRSAVDTYDPAAYARQFGFVLPGA